MSEVKELKILEKIRDMIEYAYPALAQFPKSEKYGMAADIKRIMNELLELTIEASKKESKKTTLQKMDIRLAMMKEYVRLSMKLRFLPFKKYEVWSNMLVEIGKMIGGWLKTVNQRSA